MSAVHALEKIEALKMSIREIMIGHEGVMLCISPFLALYGCTYAYTMDRYVFIFMAEEIWATENSK